MPTEPKPSGSWKFWKLQNFALVLVCLVTGLLFLWALEDWRGANSWVKYKREWEAKGEKFSLVEFAPPPVPDDKNLAMSPIVATCYSGMLTPQGKHRNPEDTNVVNRLKFSPMREGDWSGAPHLGTWQKAVLTDLQPWQQYYRDPTNKNSPKFKPNEFPTTPQPQSPALDVLFALGKYDANVEELRVEAARHPDCRFPLEYDHDLPVAILLPHLAALKGCVQGLELRAIAELEAGQTEKAFADVKLMFRMSGSVRREPFLISHLVRIAVNVITLQPIWEGMAQHRWSDAQLAEIQKQLEPLDYLKDYQLTMRGERAMHIGTTDYIRRHRGHLSDLSSVSEDDADNVTGPTILGALGRFVPNSLYYRNEMAIARMHQQYFLPLVDTEHRLVSPSLAKANDEKLTAELEHFSFSTVFARFLMPSLSGSVRKFAAAQSYADLANVACALERHRLAHGNYPDSLDALAPQFISQVPHDIINGQPLRYRRTDDGQFILYSVGFNEKDDGGEVVLSEHSTTHRVDTEQGDWVWRYPAKTP